MSMAQPRCDVDGGAHGGHARFGSLDGRFSIPDRSGHLLRHARRHPRGRRAPLAPIGAGRHADQLGEAGAERTQRGAADRETDLGDAEVATTQQRHRPLDAPRHQVAVRRLAIGEPELAAEMPGRHVRAASERLDVQRPRVLSVDPVANAPQPGEVAQVLLRGGSAGHRRDRATVTPDVPRYGHGSDARDSAREVGTASSRLRALRTRSRLPQAAVSHHRRVWLREPSSKTRRHAGFAHRRRPARFSASVSNGTHRSRVNPRQPSWVSASRPRSSSPYLAVPISARPSSVHGSVPARGVGRSSFEQPRAQPSATPSGGSCGTGTAWSARYAIAAAGDDR